MASFTDAISQFNPYVSQLPVDAMVQVGTYKQQKYEEGVQRIQGEIDKVAGLDVVRDVDKQYLQSKLNQLGSKLKTVAAGDFSNFQLVNSVGGMTKQIGKDANVQNAVSSTAWYRKQLGEIDKAVSEGKSSQANIYDFQKQAGSWLSSQKEGETFRGRYTPYRDVDKKVFDVIKTLHPKATQEDITYATDPTTGRIDYSKLSAAMVRKGYEGVSETQIANAINASLDPDDLNQLRLNANYQFRDYDANSLQEHTRREAAKSITTIDSQIERLKKVANQYSSDPAIVSQANQSIENLKQKKTFIEEDLPTQLEQIARNPDGEKFRIYKNGFVDSFANAFSWEKQTVEKLTNPELAAQHWEKEQALRESDLNIKKAQFKWDQWLDKQKLDIDLQKLDLEVEKVRGIGGGFTTYGGQNTNLEDPLTAMRKDINTTLQNANGQVRNIAADLFGKASPENIGAVEKAIETYRTAANDTQRNAIPKEWRSVVDQVIADRVKVTNLQNGINESERRIVSDPSILGTEASIKQSIKDKKGMTINIGGQSTYFSNEDIYNYLKKEKSQLETRINPITGTPIVGSKGLAIDESLLSPKERILHNIMKDVRYAGNIPVGVSSTQKTISDVFKKYDDVMQTGKAFEERKNDLISKDLLTKTGKYIPSISSIFVGSEKEGNVARAKMESIAAGILSRYTSDKAGAEGLDLTGANDVLVGDKKNSIQYQKLVQGDKTYLVMKVGNTEHVLPLTDMEASQLPKSKNEKTRDDIDVTTLQSLNNGKTNSTGDAINGYFQKVRFPNVRTLNVTGDLTADKGASSIQYLTVNLKLPSGWKTLKLDDYPMDVNKAANRVGSMTDQEIKQLFLDSRSVPQSWKDEIKNLR